MKTPKKLKTPYRDLVPPLSTTELKVLKADIKANGVRVPIDIDEEGNILDGHHRYKCDKNALTVVVSGLTDPEKQAYVIKANIARRNLSPTQKKDLLNRQKGVCLELKKDPKYTQANLAVILGVNQSCIAKWLAKSITNIPGDKGYIAESEPVLDSRVKVSTSQKEAIVDRVLDGDAQRQVASDFGITQPRVSQIVKQAEKIHARDDDKARKTANLKSKVFDLRPGDFREVLKDIRGASLILTDPPYPKSSLGLWRDLGAWAKDALADDGLLIAYSGQMYLPEVLDLLRENLKYWWCGSVTHKGPGNLTPLGSPVRKVINKWKPLVMFYKPEGCGFARTFCDFIDGTGLKKEKEKHNWAQPVAEAAVIVSRFTKEGELVVDPFAGSGGFCKAAHELGRIAVGAEILQGESEDG